MAYSPDIKKILVIPIGNRSTFTLHITQKDNKHKNIRMVKDYEFTGRVSEFGL
jgi:hypothetical protein